MRELLYGYLDCGLTQSVTSLDSKWTNLLAFSSAGLLAAYLLQAGIASLHPTYLKLLYYIPYILSGVIILLANQFRQSTTAIAAILQITIFYVIRQWLQEPLITPLPTQLFIWISILLPMNWLLLAFLSEQQIFSWFGVRYCGALLVQIGFIVVLMSLQPGMPPWAEGLLRLQGFSWSWMPILALMLHWVVIGGFLYRIYHLKTVGRELRKLRFKWLLENKDKSDNVLLACLLLNGSMLVYFSQPQISLAASIVCLSLLLVSLILHSHNLAFVDELTQLPGRRALMSDLGTNSGKYTVAMLDVDHFKKFNDTYGHDTGDEVLKFVASRMARVRGGGKAYRYGGEEFTILFRGKTLEESLPYLEEVRETIAKYRLVIRSRQRSGDHADGKQLRGQVKLEKKKVQVTISIGATQRQPQQPPLGALKQADLALYQAKESGRNRVCWK